MDTRTRTGKKMETVNWKLENGKSQDQAVFISFAIQVPVACFHSHPGFQLSISNFEFPVSNFHLRNSACQFQPPNFQVPLSIFKFEISNFRPLPCLNSDS